MKKLVTIVVIVLGIVISSGRLNAQSFGWSKQFTGNSITEGFGITTDATGNVITVGEFNGTMDFDPGPAVFNLSSLTGDDLFISKLDDNGNFLWAKQIAGTSGKDVVGVKTDNAGNIYFAGWFTGTVDFDPGPGTFNLVTNFLQDVFVCKLNTAGGLIWAKQFGNSGEDKCFSLAIDGSGNILTTGTFRLTVDFDPGPGVFNLSAPFNLEGVFVSKLDSSGNFVWARNMSGTSNVYPKTIVTDFSGNIYTGGSFYQTIDIDPGTGIFNLTSAGLKDIYLCKLDAAGNFGWAKRIGGIDEDQISEIAVDMSGFPVITGYFSGTSDFDPGPGTFTLTASGIYSPFVMRIDPLGNLLWAKQLPCSSTASSTSVSYDANSNVIVAGGFRGMIDLNPGVPAFELQSIWNDFNSFICKLDAAGIFLWGKQFESVGENVVNAVAVDGFSNVYTTGRFRTSVDFDPGPSVFYLGSNSKNTFVHKLGFCPVSTASISAVACNNYTSPSGNYVWNATGIYNDVLLNNSGCDSILTFDLTIQFIDTSVNVVNSTLTSNEPGATYQWISCSSGPVPGASGQSFTPSVNGNFAVIVTANGCSDTSACINVNNVAIMEIGSSLEIRSYPNPVHDKITMEWNRRLFDVNLTVYDLAGRLAGEYYFSTASKAEIDLPEPSGMYFVEFSALGTNRAVFKIVKR